MSMSAPEWSVTLPSLEAEILEETAGACPGIVVLIWAVWYSVCQLLDAALAQAQMNYPNLHFCGMNLDQRANWPLAKRWNVKDTRTLVFSRDGIFQESFIMQYFDTLAQAKLADWNNASQK